jgi:hypothetical protein
MDLLNTDILDEETNRFFPLINDYCKKLLDGMNL